MNKKWIAAIVVLIIASASLAFIVKPDSQEENTVEVTIGSDSTSKENIKWYTVSEALELNKKNNKKIFIDVYTTWCGPCKMLTTKTFSNAHIGKQLNEYFIPVKFNAESSDTIYFQDKRFVNQKPNSPPRQSTHDFTLFIAQTQQGIAYPTMVFLDSALNMIQPIPGFLTPEQLEPILDYIGQDLYLPEKGIPWENFMKTYQSNL